MDTVKKKYGVPGLKTHATREEMEAQIDRIVSSMRAEFGPLTVDPAAQRHFAQLIDAYTGRARAHRTRDSQALLLARVCHAVVSDVMLRFMALSPDMAEAVGRASEPGPNADEMDGIEPYVVAVAAAVRDAVRPSTSVEDLGIIADSALKGLIHVCTLED